MKTPVLTTEQAKANKKWLLIDAKGEILGRLATRVANALRGKDQPTFSPHIDCGANVVIINASAIVLSGNKITNKVYAHHTGYLGGLREVIAEKMLAENPTEIIRSAVSGMLPKNKLRDIFLKNLKVFAGTEHPYAPQLNIKSK